MKLLKSKFLTLLAAIALTAQVTIAAVPVAAQTPAANTTYSSMASTKRIDRLVFRQAMRKLWEDHVTWTRVYIIAALADLPEANTAAGRLLQNQVDIGNAIKPFYGDAAGNQLTDLLRQHILIAADLLAAAKAGDTAAFNDANTRWYENANEIAAFLHSANPENWSLADMQSMMKMHLDLTLQEATARLNGDWTGDVAAYDEIHNEILQMSDMLADGIIAQYPRKFVRREPSQQTANLTLGMDKLWEDHVTWTRIYIISVTSELPDTNAAATRLLQNQVDIGNAIKPFYGDAAGDQLTALLTQHILLAADLLAAAKAGDTAKFNEVNAQWYANANDIAEFLHNANPDNWPLADMQSMMKMHLDLTLQEASARLNGDWAGDVAAYDQVHAEILEMSGMLTDGIVAQLPKQFK